MGSVSFGRVVSLIVLGLLVGCGFGTGVAVIIAFAKGAL